MANLVILTCVSGKLFQRAIGAYQVAHHLRNHGFSVQVVDFTDDFTSDELIEILKRYLDGTTLAIGISSTFYSNLDDRFASASKKTGFDAVIPENVEKAVRWAKEIYKIPCILGGSRSHAGSHLDYVDEVFHGYAEDELLKYLLRKSEPVIFKASYDRELKKWSTHMPRQNPKFDISTGDHRFIPQDHVLPGEVLPLEISRGCIFKCKFCAFPLNGKKKLDYLRDPVLIREELEHNYERFGTTNYFINDDTFNDSTQKLEDLHREISKLPFKINFTCYLRADLLYAHREQIQLVRELGLASPFFGVETLNQKAAQTIGKGMNVHKLKDFLIELHDVHWKGEVPITCSYIVGLPHETKETVRETFAWAKSSPMSSVFFGLTLDIKSHYRSEFQKESPKYGYDVAADGTWTNEHFTQAEAVALAEEFNRELMYTSDRPSSWFLMTLLNHGMPLETARDTLVKDLDWRQLLKAKRQKIAQYKSLILKDT